MTALPWQTRQAVIFAMGQVVREAHRQMDAAQTGDPLPPDWQTVIGQAHTARAIYREEQR